MNAFEKSDIGIVPKKEPNKIGKPMAEALEERPVANGKSGRDNCDPYSETGANIAWPGQNTWSGIASRHNQRQEPGAIVVARRDLCGGCSVTCIPTATKL